LQAKAGNPRAKGRYLTRERSLVRTQPRPCWKSPHPWGFYLVWDAG
jgi:hypothetical protein